MSLKYLNTFQVMTLSAVRNYIAHDYDSTDDNIIEDVIRYNLPKFKEIIFTLKRELKL